MTEEVFVVDLNDKTRQDFATEMSSVNGYVCRQFSSVLEVKAAMKKKNPDALVVHAEQYRPFSSAVVHALRKGNPETLIVVRVPKNCPKDEMLGMFHAGASEVDNSEDLEQVHDILSRYKRVRAMCQEDLDGLTCQVLS